MPLALFSGIAARNRRFASAEMLARIIGYHWQSTDLGPMERWPTTLVGVLRLVVCSSAPLFILAGRNGLLLYNDAAVAIAQETFKSALGKSVFEVLPHANRFYQHVIAASRRGVSPRFENQPLKLWRDGRQVTALFNLIFTPIVEYDGSYLGTLVHAHETTQQVANATALAASEERFRTLVESCPQMIWSGDREGRTDYLSRRWYEFTGLAPGTVDPQVWRELVHPDDQDRVFAEWYRAIGSGEPFEMEYRFRYRSGEYRWLHVMARPMRDRNGAVARWFGTTTDIHESKCATVRLEVVSHELNHRIKNIFTLVDGLIRLSPKEEKNAESFADNLAGRIRALSLAHDLARPHPDRSREAKLLSIHVVASQLVAPYQDETGCRLRCEGPDMPLDEQQTTAVSLLLHELATNAAKYGAFCSSEGCVRLSSRIEGGFYRLTWKEIGGPPVVSAPQSAGFGTRLMALTVQNQLRGRLEKHWDPDGLRVELLLPSESVAAVARQEDAAR